MERIETTIIRNLIFNEEYSRKVIPFIQPEYFEQRTEKIIFEEVVQFITKYDSAITIEALNIEAENRSDLTEDEIKEIDSQIDKEIEEGILPDPAAMMDPETGMPVNGQSMMGDPINGEEVNGSATEVKMPKGGEI